MLMMRGWVPTQLMLMMLMMQGGAGSRPGTNAQWVSDKAWHPTEMMLMMHSGSLTRIGTTEMMLMHGCVRRGPADAHDAWLGPCPNDADDAHDVRWVRL